VFDGDGFAGRFGQQLRLATSLHGDEPPRGFVHGLAHGEQPMVAQHYRLAASQRLGDAVSLGGFVDHARVVVKQPVAFVEGARILRDRVQQPAERRPGFAAHRVGVGRRHGVGPRGVNPGMDRKGRAIDRPISFDHFALVVDQDQIGNANVPEVDTEGIYPETVGTLGVACGDVAGNSLVKPEPGEEAKGRGQAFFPVAAFLHRGREGWGYGQVRNPSRGFCTAEVSAM